MPALNEDIPQLECLVRAEFLHNFQSGQGEFVRGVCHAISSIAGRALGFHVLLENGAHIGRLPIHALVQHKDAPAVPINEPWRLQLWDCFSYHAAVTEYGYLAKSRCRVYLPDKKTAGGTYLFTVDYYGATLAETAGDTGWKCHHIIALDNGLFAAQPNNRVVFYDPSFVTPFDKPPAYKTMSRIWKTEDGAKWRSEDSDRMFYEIEEAKG